MSKVKYSDIKNSKQYEDEFILRYVESFDNLTISDLRDVAKIHGKVVNEQVKAMEDLCRNTLIKLRASFDFIYDKHRAEGKDIDFPIYATELEALIQNRLAEIPLLQYQFGKEGLSGLEEEEGN